LQTISDFFYIPNLNNPSIGPTLTRITTPQRPSDTPSRRVTLITPLEPLPLLINLVTGKERCHPLNGIRRQPHPVRNITSARNTDRSTATLELISPSQSTLRFSNHRVRRVQVQIGKRNINTERRDSRARQTTLKVLSSVQRSNLS
jgi:hypothetical protein